MPHPCAFGHDLDLEGTCANCRATMLTDAGRGFAERSAATSLVANVALQDVARSEWPLDFIRTAMIACNRKGAIPSS
jgi:hypothetical protein